MLVGVAAHQACPPDALRRLALHDVRWNVLAAVAANTATPAATLDELANHTRERIRMAVAYNRSSSPDTLERLSKDPDSDIRGAVASNPLPPPNSQTQTDPRQRPTGARNRSPLSVADSVVTFRSSRPRRRSHPRPDLRDAAPSQTSESSEDASGLRIRSRGCCWCALGSGQHERQVGRCCCLH